MSNHEDRGFNTVNNSSLSRRDQRLKLQRMTLLLIGGLMVLMVVTLMVLVIGYFVSSGSSDEQDPSKLPGGELTWEEKTVSTEVTLSGHLLLVNHTHEYTFPKNESHLTNVTKSDNYKTGEGIQMDATALKAADEMLTALGNKNVELKEAYRTAQMQEALSSSTKPGFSDHHTGLLCRIEGDEQAQAWLLENAHTYGFVQRYPEGKSETTGVPSYPAAFRYVGIAHATYMKENNLCLEEYIAYLQANVTADKPLSIKGADEHDYEVYYYAVSGDTTVKYPTNAAYTVSGTNDGGLVITVDRTAAVGSSETTADTAADTSAN